jgi:hypothetical protein
MPGNSSSNAPPFNYPSAPHYNYNIPPNQNMPPSASNVHQHQQHQPSTMQHPEKKDLNVNFLDVSVFINI